MCCPIRFGKNRVAHGGFKEIKLHSWKRRRKANGKGVPGLGGSPARVNPKTEWRNRVCGGVGGFKAP